jgi:hypothetical protein
MNPAPFSPATRKRTLRAWLTGLVIASSLCLAQQALSLDRIYLEATGIGRPSDQMGHSVALLGDTAAVGAPQSQVVNGVNTGTVDIYRLESGVWHLEQMLVPSDPAPNRAFGNSVALGPDLLVVSAADRLYTFERNGSTWQQVDEMDAYAPGQIGLSGDTLVAGATVYVRSGTGWQSQAELSHDDVYYGFTDATIDGDLIVATATGFSLNAPPRAAYFYSRSGTVWTRENSVVLAPSYTPVHLAISGHTALVGASSSKFNQVASVRVFDRDDSGTWADNGTLDAGTDFLGEVPVSIDGDLALVGSPEDNTAYTFARTGGVWNRVLHFNDPYARCFRSVALAGSTALAGCPYSYTASAGYGLAEIFSLDSKPPPIVAQFGQGTAHAGEYFGLRTVAYANTLIASSNQGTYFYDRSSTGWTQTNAFLAPPLHLDPASLALDGDTAAIGYPIQIYPGGTSEVDVYVRSGGSWALQAAIPGPPPADDSRYYAASLAVQGNVLVVGDFWDGGASSACHVFQRTGAVWQAAADLVPVGATPTDYFCWSLSMSGDTLLVGAPRTNFGIENAAGAVYVFVRSGSTWTQQARLLAPVVANGAGFGTSVAIKGDTAVIGSNNDSSPFSSTRGEVNVYRRSGTVWSWQATLDAPGTGNAPGDFGYAVALSDAADRIVATAPYDVAHDPFAGVAFAFEFDGSQWSPSITIHGAPPFPPTTNDLFGWSASFAGEDFVIGAPQDGVGGAVYVGPTSETVFANGFEATP